MTFILIKHHWWMEHIKWETKEVVCKDKKEAELIGKAWNDESNRMFNHTKVLVLEKYE